MPQKKKKMSLEEARALFIDKEQQPKKTRRNFKKNSQYKHPKTSPFNKEQIQKRILQLERRVMEGELDDDQEQKILKEIEKLEKQVS